MFEFDYQIVCDGGSRGNGTASAEGYGSYKLESRQNQTAHRALTFGKGVINNQAEYMALIAGLKDLVERIKRAGKDPKHYAVVVQTDSQLVWGHLTQGWACKAGNLTPLRYEANVYRAMFGKVEIEKVPRDEIVRVLGH